MRNDAKRFADAANPAIDDGTQSHEILQPAFKLRSRPMAATTFISQCIGKTTRSALVATKGVTAVMPFLPRMLRSAVIRRCRFWSSACRSITPRRCAAVNFTRAVLLAVGILTVSLSMIALWLVVRYVVVKPLNHLRDVSDAVTRGDLEQRADIHTNDEFEELAASFNKMLRHLMDSQGELRDLNINLDAKVDELAQLNMRLNEMNRVKGEFLASMSHELRTPLNSILGFSQVLEGIDSLPDKQKRYVQNIQNSGRKLLEMINDILDVAKMEAGKWKCGPANSASTPSYRLSAISSARWPTTKTSTCEWMSKPTSQ